MIDPQHEQQAVLTESAAAPVAAPSDSGAEILATDTEVSFKQLGQWELVWRRFKRHHLAMFGAIMLVLLSLMAIFAPLVSPESYLGYNYLVSNIQPRLTFPGAKDWVYIMGSDVQGHSLLMWVTYGARISLMVGLVSAVLSSVIGIVMGATAGYFGGWADAIVMRITDVFLTLPFLPLIIMLSYYVSQGSATLIIAIFALTSWPGVARLVRSYYLTFRQQEFTQAARAIGVSDVRIIFRHILPNAMSPVIVATSLAVAGFIIAEAAIDYLGVGIKTPNVSWGLALSNSQDYFGAGNWWWAFFPGIFILLTVLSINFLGDGLRDALDVRARE